MEQTETVWSFTSTGEETGEEKASWTKKIVSFNLDGPTSRDRPKLRWRDVVNADLRKKDLNTSLASDRPKWIKAIRPVTADCTPAHYKRNKEMK